MANMVRGTIKTMTSTEINLYLPNTEATFSLGIKLGKSLFPHSTILLQGDLGSGKTTLIQGLGQGLGITDAIVSPTFTLINEYHEGRLPLYHLDLYRLEPKEILGLNLENYWESLEVEPGIVAIEWAERIPYKPENYLLININHTEIGRQIQLIPVGNFPNSCLTTILN